MKNVKFMIISLLILLISVISLTYADEGDRRLCLTHGESVPTNGTPIYTCEHDLCFICVNSEEKPISPNRCYDVPGCEFLGGGDQETIDITPPELTVNMPEDDSLYDTRNVLFNISVGETVKIEYKVNDNPWRTLCSSCDDYDRSRRLDEGANHIIFRATDTSGNSVEKELDLFTDSKKPRIHRTYPKKNDYTTGDFTVEYSEDNLREVILYYKESDNIWKEMSITNCPSGRRQSCAINLDGDLEQGIVKYYFKIKDPVSEFKSGEVEVKVDTIIPEITLVLPEDTTYSSNRVPLDLEASEEVKFEYKKADSNRFSRLCTHCTNYNGTKYFSDGEYNLVIRATDDAGNAALITAHFMSG